MRNEDDESTGDHESPAGEHTEEDGGTAGPSEAAAAGAEDSAEAAESPDETDSVAAATEDTAVDASESATDAEAAGSGPDAVGSDADAAVTEERESTETTEAESVAAPPRQEKAPDEVYCSSCGEAIKAEAEVCPHCGVRQRSGGATQEKNSAISFIASLIIPGAGQVYNDQLGRGVAMFVGAVVADTIITVLAVVLTIILIGPLFFLLIPLVHLLIAYDAYSQAEKINSGEISP